MPCSGRGVEARVVAIPIAFNEEHAIGRVLSRFEDIKGVTVAVVDDASTDRTPAIVQERGVTLIRRTGRGGAGAAVRTAYAWAREQGYEICVIMSGNDKDRPSEIPRLVDPIVGDGADLVQGSRYLPGGIHANMPLHRRIASQYIHPWLFSFAARRRMTDTTNGYRALRLSILADPRIDLNQPWLDKYDLEPYLLFKAIRLGYVVREAPVTKIYPQPPQNYTKMKPIPDWWSILRPIVTLGLGLKK
jgi:dolichol-phosphate mannosyltransferase